MRLKGIIIVLLAAILVYSCEEKEDEVSDRFSLLTTPIWASDSLLVNGVDASGPGQRLEKFKGDAKFHEDGTGYFGEYTGTWEFNNFEEEIIIITESNAFPLTAKIIELNTSSFKITTGFTDLLGNELKIRMTFKAK